MASMNSSSLIYEILKIVILTAAAAGSCLAVAFSFYKGWTNVRQNETNKLHKEKTELLILLEKEVAAWKLRADTEHKEFVEYREKHHLQINEAQAMILKLSNDNTELKFKTDMTPMIELQKQTLHIIEKVAGVLTSLEVKISKFSPPDTK
jgi:hypothetical protein